MTFQEFQNQVKRAREHTEAKRAEYRATRRKLGNLGRKRSTLIRQISSEARDQNPELEKIGKLESELGNASVREKGAYAAAARYEWDQLREHSQFTHPIFNITNLDDEVPILLCPLRLETRFKKVQRGEDVVDQLWVRVFPDDIAINSFESDLSKTEIRNARQYWVTRWKTAAADEAGNRGAWRALAAAHGPGRAWWIFNHYKPENVGEEPDVDEGELILVIPTETELVDPVLTHARTYWEAVWKADKDNIKLTEARATLVTEVGEDQAKTIIEDYKPANLADPPPAGTTRDETVVRVEFVVFPTADELDDKLQAWSQPPATTILPERFVFLGFNDRELALPPQLGNLIPPKLIVGPDPAADEGEDFRLAGADDVDFDEGELIFSENLKWMFDFDEAVAKGMGFKIDLTPELATTGFDRVFVVGLKLGADETDGQDLLEELFDQHQISRKGLSILKQGTPTNNTETDESGYSWRHDPDDSFDIYFAETTPDDPSGWFDKRDGRWLAEILGVNPQALSEIDNYYSTDICEGRAMQRALWPATLGHFMDSMMHPVFGEQVTEQVRHFFTHFVSGRGGLPAIRVGKQPYGIVPATKFTGMEWFSIPDHSFGETDDVFIRGNRNSFLMDLYTVLLDIDRVWSTLQQQVSYIGKSGDPHQILLDVVGLHPDSAELYKRYANSLKQLHNIYTAAAYQHGGMFSSFDVWLDPAVVLLAKYGYSIIDKNPAPEILRKAFFENSWILKGPRIDKVPNTEDQSISLWTTDDKNYITWLIEAAQQSHDTLRKQENFVDDKPPTALLYLLLYHALDLSYVDTSLKLHKARGVMNAEQVAQAYVEPDFIHIEENNETESRWQYLYKTDQTITGDPDLMLEAFIPENLDTLDEAATFRDALAGMRHLEDVPTARLERVMMEHIDTVSYRYDAWMMGLVQLQLAVMRNIDPSNGDTSPRQGICLGAYGWLEDLRPENKVLTPVRLPGELETIFNPSDDLVRDSTNAGYILAPSQNHAVTAAVLRNGHLSNEEPEDREQLSIKLSSNRVRLALQIIEGIQGGQSLSALLGYQFERGLHDRTDAEVDEFIYDLRNEFPLVAKKFNSTMPADDEYDSINQIEARNVIDGSAFLKHIEDSGDASYPFGLTLPTASDTQRAAIDDEVKRLIEINDAVADLALAESVHQVVSGNYERAAATLDTYSKGNFPPIPEVIQTPRSGIILTHRVGLQFRSGLSHNITLPNVSPRMHAEPAINHWLSTIMPAMSEIVCVIDYVDATSGTDTQREITMAQLGLAPIDALYLLQGDSDQSMTALDDLVVHFAETSLTPHVGSAIKIAYTEKLTASAFTVFEISSLMASLRALLLNSKPLNAADIKLANEAAKENEQSVIPKPERLQPLVTHLDGLRTAELLTYRTDLDALITAGNMSDIIDELDNLMADLADLFIDASRYGLPETGIGFVYQWRQSMHARLVDRIEEVIARWEKAIAAYLLLIDEYNGLDGIAPPEDLFTILQKAELKVSTSATQSLPPTPAAFFTLIDTTRFDPFETFLDDRIRPLLAINSLTDLLEATVAVAADMPPFDVLGIDIADELKQVGIFVADLKNAADNLDKELGARVTESQGLIDDAAATGDAMASVELISKAAKRLLGENFVVVPEFTVDDELGTEWNNTLGAAGHTLRYLQNDLDVDFPVDDWLYGIGRVREKLYHVENTLMHIEGFNDKTLDLVPTQFPYREDDYWLGLQYPDVREGTEEPFSIDEDKLLYTAVYTDPFNPAGAQCGLLLDEWTEMIPSRDETAGLTFHYDQPNSEPPQALLLVTPSRFTGAWRWNDLVDALHETLDMAKKRAVEPDHVDLTVYSRFLPPIVSLASPMPLTATLNLALNNQVFFTKVIEQ